MRWYGSRSIFLQYLIIEPAENRCVHSPENFQGSFVCQLLSHEKSRTLIQETQCISHGSIGTFCNISKCLILYLYPLSVRQFPHPVSHGLNGHSLEIISLASGKDCYGYFIHFSSRKNKYNIFRRFLKCFQNSIKSTDRQHMYFVYNINSVVRICRSVLNLFPYLPDVVYSVITGSIYLNNIHGSTGLNGFAAFAFAAGTSVLQSALAVNSLCE